MTDKKFTHIGVETRTQKQIAILARIQPAPTSMYELVAAWTADAWEDAKLAGLVTDAMLEPTAAPEAVAVETSVAPRRRQRIGRDF